MGPIHHSGLWDRVYDPPTSESPSLERSPLHSGISTSGGGEPEVAHKGNSSGGTQYKQDRGVLLKPLSRSEKGWGLETHYKLQCGMSFISKWS